jgi:predicted HAD superfamily phosphohydrolase
MRQCMRRGRRGKVAVGSRQGKKQVVLRQECMISEADVRSNFVGSGLGLDVDLLRSLRRRGACVQACHMYDVEKWNDVSSFWHTFKPAEEA